VTTTDGYDKRCSCLVPAQPTRSIHAANTHTHIHSHAREIRNDYQPTAKLNMKCEATERKTEGTIYSHLQWQ